MSYTRVNWLNKGETGAKPINKTNLNQMDEGIKNLDGNKAEIIKLIAVTDTAPTTCTTGDMYYNKTSNEIYTATADNTWGETGETPQSICLYMDLENENLYYYDGTNFSSYGGGAGAYIGSEEPTSDTYNLWVDTDDPLNNLGTEVVDNLDGNETNKAPSVNAVKNKFGKLLWSGSFTTGSITVEGISEYNIICVNVGGCYCFGNAQYGAGGVGMYGAYTTQQYNYRFGTEGDTLTIDDLNKGGSSGTENIEVLNIWGLF